MKKYQTILIYTLPVIILLSLLIFASFYDLQISTNFADLEFGQYYSKNIFARLFEVIGETPVYFLPSISFSIFAIYFLKKIKINKNNKKIYYLNVFLIILFVLISILFNYIAFLKICTYVSRLYNFNLTLIYTFFEIIFAFVLTYLFLYLLNKLELSTLKKLSTFAIIVLLCALFTNIIVQSIKPVISRTRYRAMVFLNEHDFTNYTPWYAINKNNTITALHQTLGLTSDIYKSFPSGHTAGATCVLSLISLVYIFPNMKKRSKILIISLSIIYVLAVGFSRIIMGAHFLSDVIFSMIVGYLSFVLFNFIVLKKYKKTIH